MRHKKKGNHLGRTASHKKAMMRNMAAQVFEHKEIKTTLAKAKELRGYVERLITYGKKGTLHHRRLAFQFLQNKQAVTSLFDEIAPVYEDRNGGYSRIVKLGRRKGDGAEVSVFQLVGFEKVAEGSKPTAAKKAKAKSQEAPEAEKTAPVEETAPQADAEEQAPATAEETQDVSPEVSAEAPQVKEDTAPEAADESSDESKEK